MIGLALSAIALLAGTPPAQAEPKPVEIGPWLIQPEGDTRCHALGAVDDHVVVSFAEDARTSGNMALFGNAWKIEREDYPGSYSWDGWKTSTQVPLKALTLPNGRGVVAMGTDAAFTRKMVRAKRLWFRIPDLGFDGQIDIPEAGEVVAALAACNQRH